MKKTLLFCTLLGSLLSFQFAFAAQNYEVRLTVNGKTSNRVSNKPYTLISNCHRQKVYSAIRPVYIPLGADKTRCDAYVVAHNKHHCNVVVNNSTIVKSNNWTKHCSLSVTSFFKSSGRGTGIHYKRATINYTP